MAQYTDNVPILILFGLFVGVFAGIFGLGGGAVMVPLLVLLFGFGQKDAHGTSLAIILSPAAAPAIWKYHSLGFVQWKMVLAVAPSMLAGSYFGAWLATGLPQNVLKIAFAFVLTYVAAYMIFSKLDDLRWSVGLSLLPSAVLLVIALATGVFATPPEVTRETPTDTLLADPVVRAGEAHVGVPDDGAQADAPGGDRGRRG